MCGFAAGCVEGLHRFAQGAEKKVLRIDWPFRAEGCGIALTGDEYEVSVTGLTFSVI